MADDTPDPFSLFDRTDLSEVVSFLPALIKESDRGMVLICMSFIDELMRRILLAFFIESGASTSLVDGFNAPLSSLSTRSSAAYALGLISEQEFRECAILRKIRNKFAHAVHVSFNDPSIRDSCATLTFATKSHDDLVVSAQDAFRTAAIGLIIRLMNRPLHVARKRRVYDDWP